MAIGLKLFAEKFETRAFRISVGLQGMHKNSVLLEGMASAVP